MQVLVTGATGRMGMNVVQALQQKGYGTISFCFDTPREQELRQRLEALGTRMCLGNLATGEGVQDAVDEADAVVHCAALMQEDRAPSREMFFDINTRGTMCLLEAICRKSRPLNRLVGITSGSVYDVLSQEGPYREDQALWPLGLYGTTKILNEQMYRLYWWQHGIPTISLRPNLIVAGTEPVDIWDPSYPMGALKGNAGNPNSILCAEESEPWRRFEQALAQKPEGTLAVPYGPGRASWKWHITDARDAVQGVLCALETPEPLALGEVFNVASAQPQLWCDVVPYLAKQTKREYVELDLPVTWNVEFDISKARRLLGYDPQHDVYDTIDTALRYKAGESVDVLPPGIPH